MFIHDCVSLQTNKQKQVKQPRKDVGSPLREIINKNGGSLYVLPQNSKYIKVLKSTDLRLLQFV